MPAGTVDPDVRTGQHVAVRAYPHPLNGGRLENEVRRAAERPVRVVRDVEPCVEFAAPRAGGPALNRPRRHLEPPRVVAHPPPELALDLVDELAAGHVAVDDHRQAASADGL